MARKTKEEAQLTRTQLLDAAERLFSERGVAGTTLNDIATAAGLTRGAIYWHFQNKTDLIHALWDRVALPLQQSFDELEQFMPDDPLGRLQIKATTVLTQVVRDTQVRNLLSILLLKCEYVDAPGGLRDGYLLKRTDCLARITEGFKEAIAKGQLPADLNEKFAAIGMMSLIDGLSFHWLMNPNLFSLENKAADYVRAYLRGLATGEAA